MSVRSISELAALGLCSSEEHAALEAVSARFPVLLSDDLLGNLSKPLAAQFLPCVAELTSIDAERVDPIGDQRFSPCLGVVHRYPDRVLLMPVQECAAYCRFCFRREKVGRERGTLSPEALGHALDYIREKPDIWEVILTGGDPLILSPRRVEGIMSALAAIEHVEVVRIHTRLPVSAPSRFTSELIQAINRFQRPSRAVYLVIHVNHIDEMTPAMRCVCALAVESGIPLLSQTVLLKGVNDDSTALARLMRALVANRIKPYYLHHLDLARGAGHFRTSIAEGQALAGALRAEASGLCQPSYVLDIPGGYGKVPIAASVLRSAGDAAYWVRDRHGQEHLYEDFAESPE
ncbi:lysine 2,3-aminomutase [Azospirillaceae bacterium]